jgi:hypothetical protein
MLKNIVKYSVLIFSLASCSSLKTAFTGKNEFTGNLAIAEEKKEAKFLDAISMPVEKVTVKQEAAPAIEIIKAERKNYLTVSPIELASPLQMKYSVLLNTR